MADQLRGTPTTLATLHSATRLLATATVQATAVHGSVVLQGQHRLGAQDEQGRVQRADSTLNGVVIGLLSSFGSAILIAFVFMIVYFFRYTAGGRILLDRIGRPGEYDDEQAFAREEAEALEEMDDLQRTEYIRAKGMPQTPENDD